MVPFELWGVSLIFCSIYAVIIIIPCILVAHLGRGMINEVGRWPTKTPAIQMKVLWKLVILEVLTFFGLIAFFQFFISETMI